MKDKAEIRKHINDLCVKSIELKNLSKEKSAKDNAKIYDQQDEVYKKFMFFKEMYKELNKEK